MFSWNLSRFVFEKYKLQDQIFLNTMMISFWKYTLCWGLFFILQHSWFPPLEALQDKIWSTTPKKFDYLMKFNTTHILRITYWKAYVSESCKIEQLL